MDEARVPSMPAIADLQQRYTSFIEAINGLIFKTAVTFPLLLLVLSNPLLEFDRKRQELQRERLATEQRVAESFQFLREQWSNVAAASIHDAYTELRKDLPAPPDDLEDLDLDPAAIRSLKHRLRAVASQTGSTLQQQRRSSQRSAQQQSILEAHQADNASSARLISTYLKLFLQLQDGVRRHGELRKEISSSRIDKGKIPTPFGVFEINPQLGILSLVFAAVLTYLTFNLRLWRLNDVLQTWRLANCTAPLSAWAAPFWLYPIDGACAAAWGSRSKLDGLKMIGSVLLHGSWIALIVVLARASMHWRAEEALILPVLVSSARWLLKAGVGAAMAMFFITLLAQPVQTLLPSTDRMLPRRGMPQTHRRAFLALAVGVIVSCAAAAAYLTRRSDRSRAARVRVEDLAAARLIVNANTGTAHHPEVCRGHLPSATHRREATSTGHLHHGRSAAILEALARDALRKGQAKDAEGLLLRAIEISPLSIHLYDRLVRLYGKTKSYDRIDPILARGSASVAEAIASQRERSAGPQHDSKLSALARAFESRRQSTRARMEHAGSRTVYAA